MKRNYPFLLLLFSIFYDSINAQVNYSFSSTTAVYVPVTGGTTPTLIARPWDWVNTSLTYDEGIANNLPIGFVFNYNGIDYTNINICANGFATLGASFIEDLNYLENFYINNLKSGTLSPAFVEGVEPNTKPILAPLWDDLNCQADANLRYITTGPAGSRVFTFEWSNVKWQFDAIGNTLSFELKLYEGTNVVEFCYKDEGGLPNNASASIGLTANSPMGGGFLSLQNTSTGPTISTTAEANNLSSKPANNQVYSFKPLPCKLPTNLKYNFLNTSVSFSWEALAGVNNFEYVVDTSPLDPASGTVTASTNATISSLLPGTRYYIHLRSYCSASSKSVWVTLSSTTTKNLSPAPPIAWQKSLGGSGYDDVSFIRQTADDGYIIAGQSNSNDDDVSGNHGWVDCWIVKVDGTGVIQWQKSLGGSSYDNPGQIQQTLDGGYIFAGYTQSNDGDVIDSRGLGDCWLVKLSSLGNIEWQKRLGGSNVDVGFGIQQTTDGGYIVGGATNSNDGDVSGNHDPLGIEPDAWIVKLNADGVIEWQKCVGGNRDDIPTEIEQTTDGGYIITGNTLSTDGDITNNHGQYDAWIFKLNSSGVLIWKKTFGGSEYDGFNSVEQTADGGYIVGGTTHSSDGDITGDHSSGDVWIVRLSDKGDIVWQKYLGGSGDDYPSSIKATSDGGSIIAGTSSSNEGDVIGNHGTSDVWLIKLKNNGDFQWQKCMGGISGEGGQYAEETNDGGYIIGGNSSSNDGDVSGNHGLSDMWVVKLGPDVLLPVTRLDFSGEINGKQNLLHWTTATEISNVGFEVQRSSDGNNFSKIDFVNTKASNGNSSGAIRYDFTDNNFTATTNYYRLKQVDKDGKYSYSNVVILKNQLPKQSILSVFPNPAGNRLGVNVYALGKSKITMQVIDATGKSLLNKTAAIDWGSNNILVDISHLPPGTYILKLTTLLGGENSMIKFLKLP